MPRYVKLVRKLKTGDVYWNPYGLGYGRVITTTILRHPRIMVFSKHRDMFTWSFLKPDMLVWVKRK